MRLGNNAIILVPIPHERRYAGMRACVCVCVYSTSNR